MNALIDGLVVLCAVLYAIILIVALRQEMWLRRRCWAARYVGKDGRVFHSVLMSKPQAEQYAFMFDGEVVHKREIRE